MSLKSIRESYSKLLNTFNDAGVKLNESQKNSVDDFVLAIESTMSKQRESAIRKTKAATEAKCEQEFKTLFESVMKAVAENNEYAAKIQDLNTKLTESKKVAKSVDAYLNTYVESILPKKTIVDYDRLQKLEESQAKLKNILVVDEDAIIAKQAELNESFKTAKSNCETQLAKMQVKLNESMKHEVELQKKLDALKSVELLDSKTKNLPDFEARAMKKRLAEATAPEIEKKFDKTLESVREEAKKLANEVETTIDEEIEKIVEGEEDNESAEIPSDGSYLDDANEKEEDFSTMEEVGFNENGDVQLDESEIIDADLMKLWCRQSIEVK